MCNDKWVVCLVLLRSGVCNFEKQCSELANTINKMCPDVEVTCSKGRRGKQFIELMN